MMRLHQILTALHQSFTTDLGKISTWGWSSAPSQIARIMEYSETNARWAPDWAYGISAPMWVSDPDRKMSEINSQAEKFFDVEVDVCLRKPCYEIVAANDFSGNKFCQQHCPLRRKLKSDGSLEVVHLELPRRQPLHFHLLPIVVRGPDRRTPWLVHFVVEADLCWRLHHYIAQVATRPFVLSADFIPDSRPLTARETEILELMIKDHDIDQISRDLNLSYHTVRNHIQHILPKLSAHSIQQATAVFLLRDKKNQS